MTIDRRTCLVRLSALGVAGGALAPRRASAQNAAGAGPIRIVTPSPVGVGTDTFARLYAEHLGKRLATQAIVENRPGAAGMLGTAQVAKAAPNGQTVLVSTSLPFTTTPYLFSKVPYDAQKDFVPVAQLYRGGSFIVAGPAFKGQTLQDLVALAKQQPGKVAYASYGPGSTAHLGMELLQDAAGIQLVQIPYKASAVPDLVGGQVAIGWEPPVSALPHVRSGRLRALAYTGDRRSAIAPDVPTLAERYPGVELQTWVGAWVPAGTPDALVARLAAAFVAISTEPDVAKAIADAGAEPMATSPAQMAAHVERDAQAMRRLIKAKGISVE